MAALQGSVSWGITPLGYDTSNLATMSWDYRDNYLKSANDQLRYQVQWQYANINEATEVGIEGGVVNVIFNIETSVNLTDWKLLTKIKKSRDIANRSYIDQTSPKLHRFTIDVSQLVSDELSYSLCPMNKGTWESPFYGGMNGGLTMQDNVIGGLAPQGTPVSNYNVSDNGTFRHLRVSANFEILDSIGQIITASDFLTYAPVISLINSVNQFERDVVYYNNEFMHNSVVNSATAPKRFLTRCPNWYYSTGAGNVSYNKLVATNDDAEFLQWWVGDSFPASDANAATEVYNNIELFGTTFLADGSVENNFVMVDFNSLLENAPGADSATQFNRSQNRMLIQNVSPTYINANAKVAQNATRPYTATISPITANTHRYSLHYRGVWFSQDTSSWTSEILGASNWYEIDREAANIPYGYVRFHWLNSMGGIDSYTAKRDITEGLSVDRNIVERKNADRTWYQANSGAVNNSETSVSNSDYVSDTMRGGNLYKGGREVLGLNAEKVQSVYTDPLNRSISGWLEEILLSPNVWIEMDTEATGMGNKRNAHLRPSTKGYIPVIITNSEMEIVNETNGLVQFNIEYTLSHKVKTQRN
tara:strand:+ start:1373 stop:3142 length:1770 start_codon:yes stop_codon:yes gene_type:complete